MKTKIEFDTEATQTYQNKDCVLLLAISGTKESIREKLLEMVAEIDNDYGKPIQGVVSRFNSISHVITPIWKNKEY